MTTAGDSLPYLAQTGPDIDVFLVVVTLLGGLAIFLLGLERLTESLRLIAGDRMRSLLHKLTDNPLMGLLTGAVVTALIQSSSVTTVLAVGFIASGVMTFRQSIGVIMGANVGTTVTAQIIAFDVSRYALLIVAIGFAVTFFSNRDDRIAQGAMVMGIGLVFFGMSLMGDAMEPLRSHQGFIDFMARMESPLLGIAAALFTALVQSSSATTGVVIVLAAEGLVTLEAGIALIIGANVGTAVTAMLAALGKPREALRAAVVHTLFNVAGVVVWVFLIGQLADLVGAIGGSGARQIANAHTVFNIANTLIFIGFTGRIAALVERLVPDQVDESGIVEAKYLDESLLKTPNLALDRARLEALRMATRVQTMLAESLPAVLGGTRQQLTDLGLRDNEVDSLHAQIVAYLGRIGEQRLREASTRELLGVMEAINNLEAIGDVVETNLVGLGLSRIEQNIRASESTSEVISHFHSAVADALDLAMLAVTQKNAEAARRVADMKSEVNSLERAALAHQADRLGADEPMRVEAYRFEIDIVSNLKRVFYFTKRIARVAIPKGELADL